MALRPKQNQIRAFVAIPLPGKEQTLLAEWMIEARDRLPFQRWVHPDDLHITLFFLGDTPLSLLPQIEESLLIISRNILPFNLAMVGLGTFGRKDSPRVLWAKLEGETERLLHLHQEVSSAMKGLGFRQEERPYQPHLTLARGFMQGVQYIKPFPFPATPDRPIAFTVKGMVLFRTHFGRTPMYEAVHLFPFEEA